MAQRHNREHRTVTNRFHSIAVDLQGLRRGRGMSGNSLIKSEGRNPKPRKKPEIRIPKFERRSAISDLGLRISDFLSDLGFRPSDLTSSLWLAQRLPPRHVTL